MLDDSILVAASQEVKVEAGRGGACGGHVFCLGTELQCTASPVCQSSSDGTAKVCVCVSQVNSPPPPQRKQEP